MKLLPFFLLTSTTIILASQSSRAEPACLSTFSDFFNYERKILEVADQTNHRRDFFKKAGRSVRCAFRYYLKAQQMEKAIAGELVSPLIGYPLPKKLGQDSRYQKVHNFIREELENSPTVFADQIFQEIARSHWSVYIPLCRPELTYVCSGFLASNSEILSQPDVASAISISNIVNAAETLPANEKLKLTEQLENLKRSIPKEKRLLKKTVSEALERLQKTILHLGAVLS